MFEKLHKILRKMLEFITSWFIYILIKDSFNDCMKYFDEDGLDEDYILEEAWSLYKADVLRYKHYKKFATYIETKISTLLNHGGEDIEDNGLG